MVLNLGAFRRGARVVWREDRKAGNSYKAFDQPQKMGLPLGLWRRAASQIPPVNF